MRKQLARYLELSLLLGALGGLCAARAEAFLFSVSLETTPLIGHVAAPFFIEFQLNDGSGTGDGNNTALLSNFQFDIGAPVGSATFIGGASGDLDSNIVLAEDGFFNQFIQEFMPGNTLSFDVDLSTSIDLGPQPDQFTFAILDCTGVEIPTTGPGDPLLAVDIDSATPTVRTFGGDASRSPGCGGPPIPLETPTVVPAPAAFGLLGIGFISLLGYSKRRPRPT